jgi:hypothetical protein
MSLALAIEARARMAYAMIEMARPRMIPRFDSGGADAVGDRCSGGMTQLKPRL